MLNKCNEALTELKRLLNPFWCLMFYAALEYGWFVLAEILRSLRINGFGGGGREEGEGARVWTAEILRNFLKDFMWKMKGNMYL